MSSSQHRPPGHGRTAVSSLSLLRGLLSPWGAVRAQASGPRRNRCPLPLPSEGLAEPLGGCQRCWGVVWVCRGSLSSLRGRRGAPWCVQARVAGHLCLGRLPWRAGTKGPACGLSVVKAVDGRGAARRPGDSSCLASGTLAPGEHQHPAEQRTGSRGPRPCAPPDSVQRAEWGRPGPAELSGAHGVGS